MTRTWSVCWGVESVLVIVPSSLVGWLVEWTCSRISDAASITRIIGHLCHPNWVACFYSSVTVVVGLGVAAEDVKDAEQHKANVPYIVL